MASLTILTYEVKVANLSLSTIETNSQAIINHDVNGLTVGQQESDGYINATRLTHAHKQMTGQRRDVANWLSNKRVQETINHLSVVTGIPVTGLYKVVQGGTPDKQGTWIHPKLATRFAIWLSDDFGLMVEEWVHKWSTNPKQHSQPKLPQTYAEALLEAGRLALELEKLEAEKALLEQENSELSKNLDELFDYSSIVRIAKFNQVSEKIFNWRSLKAMSIKMGKEIKKVPCPRFETKSLYSHDVWRVTYPEMKLPETTTLVISRG